MLVKTRGASLYGMDAIGIQVEVNVSMGQGYCIVGLPDTAVKESLHRTEIAIKANGFQMPRTKLVINLAPADIKKEGKDVTLVSFGKILKLAMQAAADLEQEGISVEVIDLRTIRPLDYETVLNSVKKTNRLVVLEEAWPFGSVASEITYMVQQKAFDYLDAPIKRITTPDAPAPYSAALFAEWFPKLEKVKQEIKNVLYVKS